jgi:hypothetical protein
MTRFVARPGGRPGRPGPNGALWMPDAGHDIVGAVRAGDH